MIECHPLLRPIVQLAKPVVHAVRTWHPRIVGVRHHVHHHLHRVLAAASPPQAVMTVCQRVAGPIVAGGLILLPPASAVPPVGGVGGFPGAIVPEYGAPAFGPGYASNGPVAYGPGGGYGPAALGLGGIGPGILAPGGVTGGSAAEQVPTLITSNAPATSTPIITQRSPDTPTPIDKVPGISIPQTPGTTPPGANGPGPGVPPGGSVPPGTGGPPGTGVPPGNGSPPGNSSPPGTPEGPPTVDTPEPASIAILASGLAIVIFSRALWQRRSRRG